VDQANNIALLELFLALFLGLLFRVNVVSDDAAEGKLFEGKLQGKWLALGVVHESERECASVRERATDGRRQSTLLVKKCRIL
jgi:hypothetical protein